MYADFSKDRIDAFLKDIAGQDETSAFEQVSEDLLDDIMLAQMEMSRYRAAKAQNLDFVPRARKFVEPARVHPADMC
jgi:hypothetical protein